jgi:predicted ferric reductase
MTAVAIWLLLAAGMLVPVGLAAASPLLPSREPLWIFGGMAGVVALALLLVQPLLAAGLLPGPSILTARRWHRWIGATIVAAVLLHVGGLYLYSPDDISDALLLVSPTPFAVYGVIGLVGVILTALLAAVRSRVGVRYGVWRIVHNAVSVVVVVSSVVHAVMIEGAMGFVSKAVLCGLVIAAAIVALLRVHVKWPRLRGFWGS